MLLLYNNFIWQERFKEHILLNFYISHITHDSFDYQPTEKTNKYIWRYLSSSGLIKIDDFLKKTSTGRAQAMKTYVLLRKIILLGSKRPTVQAF